MPHRGWGGSMGTGGEEDSWRSISISTPPTVKKYRYPSAVSQEEEGSVSSLSVSSPVKKYRAVQGSVFSQDSVMYPPPQDSVISHEAYDQGLSRLEAKTQRAILEKHVSSSSYLPDAGSKGAPLDRLCGQLHALRRARASPSVPQVAARAMKTATNTLLTLRERCAI